MESSKYIVKENPEVGRYVVSSRKLEKAEEILSELPFAIGPKEESYLLCLGCYRPLDPSPSSLCSVCSWPVCSEECSQNEWHKNYECGVFSKAKVKYQIDGDESAQLSCITPLRTLLASQLEAGGRWETEVEAMESHLDERRRSKAPEILEAERVNIILFLREKCQLDRFSAELIEKVIGLLEVNAFEVITRCSSAIRGLYPKTALLNHSCVANTIHSIDTADNYRLRLRTTVEVGEGTQLHSSYTSCLRPTLVRRALLREHKYFSCSCERCGDPTELSTHLSTLKCTKCDNGLITSTQPLDEEAEWRCSHCENRLSGGTVRKVFEAMEAELDRLEGMGACSERLEATERIFRGYKSVLHPRNAYNVLIWHSLIQLYGHVDGYSLDMMPDLLLERKSSFCKDLLHVLDKVEPGATRMRGMILYEFHVSQLLLARSQYQQGLISGESLQRAGGEVLRALGESADILGLEPAGSPEATLATVARSSLAQLEQSLASVEPS